MYMENWYSRLGIKGSLEANMLATLSITDYTWIDVQNKVKRLIKLVVLKEVNEP